MNLLNTEQKIKNHLLLFLKKVVQDKTKHTHWLNTLAFMEHLGARKIIKSQNSFKLNHTLLQHISEEARHAFYFKNLAHQLSPLDCPTFEDLYTIKGSASEDYFQSIDHQAEKELIGSSFKESLNYLYTTWMIEERAVKVYELYNQVLTENKFSFHLALILREEDQHLKTVITSIQQTDEQFKDRKKKLFEYEQNQFQKLLNEYHLAV